MPIFLRGHKTQFSCSLNGFLIESIPEPSNHLDVCYRPISIKHHGQFYCALDLSAPSLFGVSRNRARQDLRSSRYVAHTKNIVVVNARTRTTTGSAVRSRADTVSWLAAGGTV